jgi:hypothetical protein
VEAHVVKALTVRAYQALRIDAQIGLNLRPLPEGQPDVYPIDVCIRLPVLPAETLEETAARIMKFIVLELATLVWTNYRRHLRDCSEAYIGRLRIDDHDLSLVVRAYFELR